MCVLFILFKIRVQQRKHRSHSQRYLFLDFFCQVKDLDCEGIFGNIEGVLEISQKLLKNLENAVQDKEGKDQELGNAHDENSLCSLSCCPFNFTVVGRIRFH